MSFLEHTVDFASANTAHIMAGSTIVQLAIALLIGVKSYLARRDIRKAREDLQGPAFMASLARSIIAVRTDTSK